MISIHILPEMSIQNPGFLTEKRRQYLKMTEEEKNSEYTPEQRHQMDLAIRRHASQAIKDLVLVAKTVKKKDAERIFDIEGVRFLIRAILLQRSHDGLKEWGGKKLFYQEFLDDIKLIMSETERRHTGQKFELNYGPSGYGSSSRLKSIDEYLKE